MKFNPSNRKLYTNEGVLIKELHCPRGVKWNDLIQTDLIKRDCKFCENTIIDIRDMEDGKVLAIAMENSSACLKLDLNDPNIRVINHYV
jgi:hypothetical protein